MSNQEEAASDAPFVADEKTYEGFTSSAISHFNDALGEYSERLQSEASSIEQMERTVEGAVEITAAHVEEAKWVLMRRARKNASSSRWVVISRISQTIMAGAIGVGASNFEEKWGAVLCVVAILIGSILLVVERELSREV